MLAGDLHAGEPVRTLNGQIATIAWVHTVPGQADYYNLTVADDHTYAVGDGQYVVHNDDCLPSLSKDQIESGLNDAKAYYDMHAGSDGADAATIARPLGRENTIARGFNAELDGAVEHPLAPRESLAPWQPAGMLNCGEGYCLMHLADQGLTDEPIDLFMYHQNGYPPCRACWETIQNYADTYQQPVRIWWRDEGVPTHDVVWPTP